MGEPTNKERHKGGVRVNGVHCYDSHAVVKLVIVLVKAEDKDFQKRDKLSLSPKS